MQATGKSLAAYMEEKLWTQIGVQHDAYWTLNNDKELAMGGLSISLRDYVHDLPDFICITADTTENKSCPHNG